MSDAPFDLVDAKDSFTDTDWFHACLKTQTPYVVVRSGETSADVLWDFVTLPPGCDSRLQADFAALRREAQAIFDRFAIADSYLRVKPTLICFDHLPLDQAKRAAIELHGLIASYLPPGPPGSAVDGEDDALAPARAIPNIPRTHPTYANRRLWVDQGLQESSAA